MTATTEPRQAPVQVAVRNGHLLAQVLVPVIGQREAQMVHEEINRALSGFEGKGRFFVLDLSQVMMLSSLGLVMCIDTRHRAIERGMRPLLSGVQPSLLDLLRMMKMDRLFTLVHGDTELARILDT